MPGRGKRLDPPPIRSELFDQPEKKQARKWVADGVWTRWLVQVFESIVRGELKEITYSDDANGDLADQVFFIANRAYEVTAIQENHSTLGTDGSAVSLQVTKDVDGEAPGAGKNLLTTAFSLKTTVDTTQSGTLTATLADRKLAAGNRLAVDFAGVLTAVAGVAVTVTLKPI